MRLTGRVAAQSPQRFGQRAAALRCLAALLAGGRCGAHALVAWHENAPASLRPSLRRLSGRVALGAAEAGALAEATDALGRDAPTLAALWACGAELGADLVALVESLADVIEVRRAHAAHAAALTAGARLSGGLVAGLPLLCLPLLPAARAPMTDALALLMLSTGVALAIGGLRWIVRLVPSPVEDPVADLAEVTAALVTAGPSLDTALDVLAQHAPGEAGDRLARARRLVAMGATWPAALQRSEHEPLRALGRTLDGAHDDGLPVAGRLRRLAASRRADQARAFEQSLRRAPVLMVVPLTLCVLPAFALLGIGPFLRALAGG